MRCILHLAPLHINHQSQWTLAAGNGYLRPGDHIQYISGFDSIDRLHGTKRSEKGTQAKKMEIRFQISTCTYLPTIKVWEEGVSSSR